MQMALSQDDLMRKWTIQRIICHFYLSYAEFKAEFDSEFAACFPTEMTQLAEFQEDGLLELNEDHLRITDTGKVFVRNICMLFDAYINKDDTPKVRYSNTV